MTRAVVGFTLADAVVDALLDCAKVNKSVEVKPASVLWTDAEGQWVRVVPKLRERLASLLSLGAFEKHLGQGPAIWLKCAVAGVLSDFPATAQLPVAYLPGVSRTDLRAIESCPRGLQPLAELQYRGVFWSQSNGRDWTVNAFLSSKNGGLGLDVAQDRATQEALRQATEAGVLFEHKVAELKGRTINAEWLLSLLAPNPTRDLLVWMNQHASAEAEWGPIHWDVFVKRCRADFGFDPKADGPLKAAELLAGASGRWSAVWELYRDSFTSFPNVYDLLATVQPPQTDLFDAQQLLAGYPQANDEGEASLRNALRDCVSLTDTQAREVILDAEKSHEVRRSWIWARMNRSSLAQALEHLAKVAMATVQLPTGSTPDELASSYQSSGWTVDAAAISALAAVSTKADLDAVSAALRAVYLPWLEAGAHRLQDAVKAAGGSGKRRLSVSEAPLDGLCTVFVDGLRYDVAVQLKSRLAVLGTSSLEARWTSLPSVTASGKAWCSPVAELIAGLPADQEFEPRVAADGKPLSAHNFRKLLNDNGVQPLARHEMGDPSGRAWVECGDLDHYGHEHGIRLARDLDKQLDQVVERIEELSLAGWKRFRIVTDHGWLLLPGGLPKTELPKHQAETRWGRCAVLKDTAHGTPLTFGWDWCADVQVAFAPGVSCFVAGNEYAHGGLSVQESLVPVIELVANGAAGSQSSAVITSVVWKGLRCVVEVASQATGLHVDLRTKAAVPSSSLVASIKPVQGGKANLAAMDDDHIGSAAVVVVLDEAGEVIQKMATTVGG